MTPLRFAVIGSPVAHSKSPQMHEAAYRALGLPHRYEKLETRPDEVGSRVEALRARVFAGLNVTVPHKQAVLAFVDEVDASAEAMGAANTLVRTGEGKIRAYNTDAPALRDELADLAGGTGMLRGRSAIVFGSGGAARAATFALGQLGVAHVVVRARRAEGALAEILGVVAPNATLTFEELSRPSAERRDLGAVVQATTAGMDGSGVAGEIVTGAMAWESVPADAVVYDVVYAPARTPLVLRAEECGLRAASGLGMLVRQGALAFELWLGVAPPLDVMRAAIAS
jgi:shikimate dehydrogenase